MPGWAEFIDIQRLLTDTTVLADKPQTATVCMRLSHYIKCTKAKKLSVSLNSLSFQFHKLTLSLQEGVLCNGMHLLQIGGGWESEPKATRPPLLGFLS